MTILPLEAPLLDAFVLLLLLHERHQVGDRLLHHRGRLHDLRQEHLAGAEEIADHVHSVHQRAFDHMQRALGREPRLLDIRFDEIGDAVHERVGRAAPPPGRSRQRRSASFFSLPWPPR
jgi:hypothetical protein